MLVTYDFSFKSVKQWKLKSENAITSGKRQKVELVEWRRDEKKKRKCCGVISEGERLDMDIQIYRESKGEQDIVRERERTGSRGRKHTSIIKLCEQSRQIITIAHSTHNDHNNPPRTGFMELI